MSCVEADERKVAGMVCDEVRGDPATRPCAGSIMKFQKHVAVSNDSDQDARWRLSANQLGIVHNSHTRMSQPAVTQVPYRQIRARQPTPDTIIVYQAYSAAIANAAVAQQRLDASEEFKVGRMTWIKPSFYWCMYRAGWSYKDPRQERILQITMSKEGFLASLGEASSSSGPDVGKTKGAVVRYQWDPERNIRLESLPYRSLQLGISGIMVSKWINEWIVGIEDITEDVRRWKGYLDKDGEEGIEKVKQEFLSKGNEDVFEVGEELEARLGMKETGKVAAGVTAS